MGSLRVLASLSPLLPFPPPALERGMRTVRVLKNCPRTLAQRTLAPPALVGPTSTAPAATVKYLVTVDQVLLQSQEIIQKCEKGCACCSRRRKEAIEVRTAKHLSLTLSSNNNNHHHNSIHLGIIILHSSNLHQ